MTWEISVPHRDRDEPLDGSTIFDLAAVLPDHEERAVARELLVQARLRGARSVGDLLDEVGDASPGERRVLLDEARTAAGLPTTGEVDAVREFERVQEGARMRASRGSGLQFCHAAGCNAVPVDPMTGILTTTTVRRWWCRAHADQAAPGDLEPPQMRLAYRPGGAVVDLAEQEAHAQQVRAAVESSERLRAARLAEQEAGAPGREALRKAQREQLLRELPTGLSV